MSADLIKRIVAQPGNARPWEAWYRAAYPKLYYAAFRLSGGNADVARELTQESFTRFLEYKAIERVADEQHALAYLIKSCHNLAVDRNAHAREILLEDVIDIESVPAPLEPASQAVDLEHALDQLNVDDRALIQRVREGRSVAEIARELGITYTAAGVRIHRLKKRLSEALG